jgi:Uma2 family endonuclease
MVMPVVVPRYTLADLDSFPDDGNRYELLDGILLVSPGPAPLHEVIVARLISTLNGYLGRSAIVFPRGTVEVAPNLHLEPDVLVIPANEPPDGIREGTRWTAVKRWWLVVEVSGSGSRVYDRDHKSPAYRALGVREVWRADLDERCIEVLQPGVGGVRRETEQLIWHPPELASPLQIDIPRLFETSSRS